jgi:hypothetical protein
MPLLIKENDATIIQVEGDTCPDIPLHLVPEVPVTPESFYH